MNQDLARVALQVADAESARLSDLPISRAVILTVATVSPTTVSWRGKNVPIAGKNANYTPVVGHRVKCALVDGQLLIEYRIDGQP
jgi:hypothetical protein